MKKDDYVGSLEELLIFMCQTYEEMQDSLLELAKEGNEAFTKVPMIQGYSNTMGISQIAKLKFRTPKIGLAEVFEVLEDRNMLKQYAECEDCDYQTENMSERDLVFKVCMDGGYIQSDKDGGYYSQCPKCEGSNLSLYNG